MFRVYYRLIGFRVQGYRVWGLGLRVSSSKQLLTHTEITEAWTRYSSAGLLAKGLARTWTAPVSGIMTANPNMSGI